MGDENPIRTLGDYSKPSHEGYRNTITLSEGNNVDPSPHGRILLLVSLLNSFHWEGLQNFTTTSLCSNNIKENLSLKHELVSKTYSKKSLIMSSGGKLHDRNAKESWALLEDLALYDNEMVLTTLSIAWKISSNILLIMRLRVPNKRECLTRIYSSIDAIIICPKQPNKPHDDKSKGEEREERSNLENLDTTPPSPHDLSISFVTEKVRKLNLFLESMLYNWIMQRKLDPKEDINRGAKNFIGRIKGVYVFVGNFTCVIDFMIVKDIGSIIDPRLSQVVLWKPIVEISNMTHDPPEGVVRFTNETNEIAYMMPHKIEQYNSLSDLEKDHTKSFYLRNEEDKRRVEHVMSKILGFSKECLELGPEYLNGVTDEEEVM
nr:retrotransposon Orf1 [Tanacetum cinerariifolium]